MHVYMQGPRDVDIPCKRNRCWRRLLAAIALVGTPSAEVSNFHAQSFWCSLRCRQPSHIRTSGRRPRTLGGAAWSYTHRRKRKLAHKGILPPPVH